MLTTYIFFSKKIMFFLSQNNSIFNSNMNFGGNNNSNNNFDNSNPKKPKNINAKNKKKNYSNKKNNTNRIETKNIDTKKPQNKNNQKNTNFKKSKNNKLNNKKNNTNQINKKHIDFSDKHYLNNNIQKNSYKNNHKKNKTSKYNHQFKNKQNNKQLNNQYKNNIDNFDLSYKNKINQYDIKNINYIDDLNEEDNQIFEQYYENDSDNFNEAYNEYDDSPNLENNNFNQDEKDYYVDYNNQKNSNNVYDNDGYYQEDNYQFNNDQKDQYDDYENSPNLENNNFDEDEQDYYVDYTNQENNNNFYNNNYQEDNDNCDNYVDCNTESSIDEFNNDQKDQYDDYEDSLNLENNNFNENQQSDDYNYEDYNANQNQINNNHKNDYLKPYYKYNNDNFNDENYSEQLYKFKEYQGFTWKKMFYLFIIIILSIAAIIGGVFLYRNIGSILNKNPIDVSRSSDTQNNLTTDFQKSKNEDAINAVKYISQRTISLQFYMRKDQKIWSTSGTGWIFNKEKNNDIYYIATNIHVSSALTYPGHEVYKDGESLSEFKDAKYFATSIGFVDFKDKNIDSNDFYSFNNVKYLGVETPELAYMATTDFDLDNFGKKYIDVLESNSENQGMIDFAILKFDFSLKSLRSSENILRNQNNIESFRNWLKYYDETPTQFYNKPIGQLYGKEGSQVQFFPYLYMGGFPSVNNNQFIRENQVKLSSGVISLNISKTAWKAFSDYTISIKNQTIDDKKIKLLKKGFSAQQYYNDIARGEINWLNRNKFDKNNKRMVNPTNYFDNFNNKLNYYNVGYQLVQDAASVSGASGSMIIFKDKTDNQFKVVGIYWGKIIVNDESYGVGNFLNFKFDNKLFKNNFESLKDFPSYDIFKYATKKIKNRLVKEINNINVNKKVELVYEYESQNDDA